jgi:hypothetical protein
VARIAQVCCSLLRRWKKRKHQEPEIPGNGRCVPYIPGPIFARIQQARCFCEVFPFLLWGFSLKISHQLIYFSIDLNKESERTENRCREKETGARHRDLRTMDAKDDRCARGNCRNTDGNRRIWPGRMGSPKMRPQPPPGAHPTGSPQQRARLPGVLTNSAQYFGCRGEVGTAASVAQRITHPCGVRAHQAPGNRLLRVRIPRRQQPIHKATRRVGRHSPAWNPHQGVWTLLT